MTRKTRGVLLFAAASGVLFFLYAIRGVLTPFALAAVIAYLANPLVKAFESRQIPRHASILLVYVVFGVAVVFAVNLVVPLLVRELNDILATLPERARSLEGYATKGMHWLEHLPGPAPVQNVAAATVTRLQDLVRTLATRTLDILFSLLSQALYWVLAPFLAYYILRDWEQLQRSILSLVPTRHRDEVVAVARRLNRVGQGFIRGQIIVSAMVAALTAAGLFVLKVDYAALIGVVAGLFDIIPYLGPIIGGIPAVLLGLMRSPSTAVWAALWIVIVHQVEGLLLQPRIMGDHVGLHPLTVFFAILAGGDLFGFWGMLVAVPVAATVKVVGTYMVERLSSGQ